MSPGLLDLILYQEVMVDISRRKFLKSAGKAVGGGIAAAMVVKAYEPDTTPRTPERKSPSFMAGYSESELRGLSISTSSAFLLSDSRWEEI